LISRGIKKKRRSRFALGRRKKKTSSSARAPTTPGLGAAVGVQPHLYELERRRNLRSDAVGSSSEGHTSGQMRVKESLRRFLPATQRWEIRGQGGAARSASCNTLRMVITREQDASARAGGRVRGKRAKLRRPLPCLIFVAISHLGAGRCFRPCAVQSNLHKRGGERGEGRGRIEGRT